MSEVIFCKTRYQDHGYHSYRDFWALVDLAGYPVIYVDQIDPASDHTYIVTPLNGEWLHGWQQPRARIIHWELEWRTDWRAEANEPPGVACVWTSDYAYARQIGAKYVCLGSDPLLNLEPGAAAEKRFDFIMLSYLTHRRATIRQLLTEAGVTFAPDGWGWERHHALTQARAMLHVHQHDRVATIAPLRWAIAAAYRLPVLTERLHDSTLLAPCMQAAYEDLVPVARRSARSNLQSFGDGLYDDLCINRTFRKCVEGAL